MIRFFLFQTIFSLCIIFSLGCSDENDLTSSQEMVQYSSLEKCSSSQQNMSSSSMQIESSSTINVSSSDENIMTSSSSEQYDEFSSSEIDSSSSQQNMSSSSMQIESSSTINVSSSDENIMTSSSSEQYDESSSSEIDSSSDGNMQDSSFYNAGENVLTDFRDGHVYKTVIIGNQIWMAENLKLQKFGEMNIKSFCYDNNSENCELVGGLYIRSSALDSAALFSKNSKGCGNIGKACSIVKPVRGICPQNWHIPDSLEWTNLVDAVEGDKLNLRATNGWRETCYENPTIGKYGFDALPGYKDDTNFINNAANFWVGESTTRAMIISCWEQSTYIIYAARPEFAYSIRCIKDSE